MANVLNFLSSLDTSLKTTAADAMGATAALQNEAAAAAATAGIEGGAGGGPDGMGGVGGADPGSDTHAGRTGNLPRARIISVSTSSEAELIKELKSGQGRQTPTMGSN